MQIIASSEFKPFLFQRWPTDVPELQPAVKSLFDLLRSLGDRVLCAMAIGLGLVSTVYMQVYTWIPFKKSTLKSSVHLSMVLVMAGFQSQHLH